MLPSVTPKFETFIAPARRYPQIWRLLAGVILAGVIYTLFLIGVFVLAKLAFGRFGITAFAESEILGTNPAELAVVLLTFTGLSLGTAASARLLHKRGFWSLFGPDLWQVLRNFLLVFVIVLIPLALWGAISTYLEPPLPNLDPVLWLKWLPFALMLLFIQISAEEVFFRGYLQQQLAARFSSRWVWWVLPSAMFGLLHLEPGTMGSNAWLVVGATTLVGLIAADLTCRTGNLGAALGLHFANNFFAILFVSVDGSLSGLSLYVTPYAATDEAIMRPLLILDISIYLVGYFIYLMIMRRKGL